MHSQFELSYIGRILLTPIQKGHRHDCLVRARETLRLVGSIRHWC